MENKIGSCAAHRRVDLTERLKKLKCRTLIIVGEQSPFHHEAMHISTQMHRRYNALIEVTRSLSQSTFAAVEGLFFTLLLQFRFLLYWDRDFAC